MVPTGAPKIKVLGYMVNRLYGRFFLDKTVDHISDLHCTRFKTE